jgi:deferrochelatase/peroxidase EfeB
MDRLLEGNAAAGCPLSTVDELREAGGGQGEREPFGFADGGSQPAVEGVDLDPVGDGVYAARAGAGGPLRQRAEDLGIARAPRAWRLIRAGEFLLGYVNEDGTEPPGPPDPLGPNGTFMVYRELDQDVDGFTEYVVRQARRHGMEPHMLQEKIVGRRRDDGSTLVRPAEDFPQPLPGRRPDERNGRRRRSNDFLYATDPHGHRCPLGSHVRRTNPRDTLPGGGERTMRHRIIRRGMRYKPPQQGLVFICFSASITNGFEFIQRFWINDGAALGLGSDPDFLLQQADPDTERPRGHMVIPGYRPIVLPPPEKPFVTVRSCEYLFVPSRRACAWLAGLLATS